MSARLFICKECGYETANPKSFTCHLRKHSLSIKDYYDKHLKQDNDGFCCICGKHTKFAGLCSGYKKFCSSSCATASPETQKKIKQTCKKKYGCERFQQTAEYHEKCICTNRKKFNADYYTQTDEFKNRVEKISMQKYNTHWPGHSETAKEKRKITMRAKYNADSYLESEHFKQHKYQFKNGSSTYIYDNIIFDSSWELAFYIYLKHRNIEFTYHPNTAFTYLEDNKEKHYYPDFKVGENFIEIKGDMFYDTNYKYHMSSEKINCIHSHATVMTSNDMHDIFDYLKTNMNLTVCKLKRMYKCN